MAKNKIYPTDGELEILHILWEKGPQTVKQVNNYLAAKKEVGYTTTLKIMQIMNEKGLVVREKEGKSHIYSSNVTRDDTQRHIVDKVLSTVFQGSAKNLVMQTLGNHRSDQKELSAIKAFLDSLDDSQKGGGKDV